MDIEEVVGGAVEAGLYRLLRQRLEKVMPLAAPAAGGELSAVVPSGVFWEVLALRAQLATSAVAATRVPTLQFLLGGSIAAGVPSAGGQATGTSARHGWVVGASAAGGFAGNLDFSAGMPALLASPGDTLRTVTTALDVGDQWSAGVLTVLEWSVDAVERNLEWLGEALR